MVRAENDNQPVLVLMTNTETVSCWRQLRTLLALESDVEFLDLALEAQNLFGHLDRLTSSRQPEMEATNSCLTLSLSLDAHAALAALCEQTGRSREQTIREAIGTLASIAQSEQDMRPRNARA